MFENFAGFFFIIKYYTNEINFIKYIDCVLVKYRVFFIFKLLYDEIKMYYYYEIFTCQI